MKRKFFWIIMIIFIFGTIYVSIKFSRMENLKNNLAVYVDNILKDSIPKKGEAIISKIICDNDATASWNNEKWSLEVSNLSKKTKCNIYFATYSGETIFDFNYTGGEQTFIVPVTGTYKLETWGAEGGTYKEEYHGGYGGYSTGLIKLEKDQILNIVAGGKGESGTATISQNYGGGGYNGGGSRSGWTGENCDLGSSGGGGATHIATKSGLLSTLENEKNSILIVSGGGGGAGYIDGGWNYNPTDIPSGGGFQGKSGQSDSSRGGLPGTQNSGAAFGRGDNCSNINVCDGGGGGYYGGKTGHSGAGGGSGYIGNLSLTNKVMYCYNCEESSEESTKTISTTCTSETPIKNCAKIGNGYARITLLSVD